MNSEISNRSLKVEKKLETTIAKLWQCWSDPMLIKDWWGPNGFTNTIHKMEFVEGGEWNLTMHGPDGTNYPNKSIYKTIIPFQKIVFEHFNPHFITTITMKAIDKFVLLNWQMFFDTEEMFQIVVKAHHADEGLKQNIEKLEKYLQKING